MQTENESPAELSGVNESEQPERPDSSEATTEQVLAEVERRLAEKQRASGQGQSRVVLLADRVVFWLSKHWLSVFNTVILLYVGLPVLAPILMFLNAKWPATIIYTIYRPLCHQLPQRSFFLFGPQLAYTAVELTERVGMPIGLDLATRAFVGNETLGYKMALCQRDISIYGAMLFFGLLYGVLRRWWKVPPLPWWGYIGLGVVPLLLDGGYQFLSYMMPLIWPDGPIMPFETTPARRVITGSLFGLATVWLAYPAVQETMEEALETLRRKYGWE
jgi:uncharacterized membrane protein